MPFNHWLRHDLLDIFNDTLSEKSIRQRGLVDVKTALAIKDQFVQGHTNWTRPWLLMMLELWCREVLDAPQANYQQMISTPVSVSQ
jgi:asparagine synthase (glutamine-hydrolysing)